MSTMGYGIGGDIYGSPIYSFKIEINEDCYIWVRPRLNTEINIGKINELPKRPNCLPQEIWDGFLKYRERVDNEHRASETE